jgi:DNA-binding NarL/FixJ family response regulator
VDKRARFLVVEDDPLCLRNVVRIVSRHGEAVPARSIREAKACLAGVDCWKAFIIGVGLPDGCGLELLRHLRTMHPLVAAAVVASVLDSETVNTVADLGAYCFVKPLRAPILERFLANTSSLSLRIAKTSRAWTIVYGLTDAEADVLRRCALGESRELIAAARGSSALTLQKHVSNLLRRTRDESLQAAAARLLRDAAEN